MGQKDAIEQGHTGSVAAVAAQTWTGAETYECKGNTRAALASQTIESSANPAILASGNCERRTGHRTLTGATYPSTRLAAGRSARPRRPWLSPPRARPSAFGAGR